MRPTISASSSTSSTAGRPLARAPITAEAQSRPTAGSPRTGGCSFQKRFKTATALAGGPTHLRWARRPSDPAGNRHYIRVVPRKRISAAARARTLVASVVIACLVGCAAANADVGTTAHAVASVFFVKGSQFAPRTRAVPPGEAPARAAIEALLAGPTASERAAGIDTTLPRGIKLASLDVKAGTATVGLTRAPAAATASDVSLRPARAAQVVYTLTAVPGVEQVLIKVNV